MSYEFLTKRFQRAAVMQMYLSQNERKPIVYLDDRSAGATLFFMSNGVPRKHLTPVNFSSAEADEIEARTGIKCVVRCIDEYVFDAAENTQSVVWLDYTCRAFRNDVIQQCLKLAPYVSVTLSTRGRQRSDIIADVRRVAKKYGSLLESPTFYKGKSDVENMMRFTLARNAKESPTGNKPPEKHTPQYFLRTPLFRNGDRVYVHWHDVWRTGVVASVEEGKDLSVIIDCNGITASVPTSSVRRNANVPSETRLNEIVGTIIRMPTSLWRNTKMIGYDDVKTIAKKFHFRVMKRYTGKNRFGVSAISKTTGRPMASMEKFTLSYEQIACFSSK